MKELMEKGYTMMRRELSEITIIIIFDRHGCYVCAANENDLDEVAEIMGL